VEKHLSKLWLCYIWKHHQWTSPLKEGVPIRVPEKDASMQEIKQCFYESAKMYCKRCGYEYPLSKRILK